MNKTQTDQVKDAEALIRAHENVIRVTRTNMNNDEFFERTCKEHEDAIASHQRQLDALRDSRTNGLVIIENEQAAIKRLRALIKRLGAQSKIDKLKQLLAEIEQLKQEVTNVDSES